jgi:hypothetical protein
LTFDDVTAVIVTRGDVDMSWTKDLPYGEVIVWDNSQQARDSKVFGRYVAAEGATRPLIYFQDDDVRFHEHAGLLESYEPGVLVSNMYDEWIQDCGYFDLALVGLGSIMDKGLWRVPLKRYLEAYGEDDRFLLDADFIFGTLARWKRIDFGHEILDIASDDTRLWKQEGQLEGKWRSIRNARALRRVVLTMMTKNEENNIVGALNSADGLFDSLLLLDTGSTDDTIFVADTWASVNCVPFDVIERPFTNFGEMRNLLLEEGRKRGEYMLLMDADETFEFNSLQQYGAPRTWPELEADGYVLHYEGDLDCGQPRLLSSNFPWRFDGIVHAALDNPTGMTPRGVNLQQPRIRHHGDTRHGTKKLERDIELLTKRSSSVAMYRDTSSCVARHTKVSVASMTRSSTTDVASSFERRRRGVLLGSASACSRASTSTTSQERWSTYWPPGRNGRHASNRCVRWPSTRRHSQTRRRTRRTISFSFTGISTNPTLLKERSNGKAPWIRRHRRTRRSRGRACGSQLWFGHEPHVRDFAGKDRSRCVAGIGLLSQDGGNVRSQDRKPDELRRRLRG